MARGALVSTVCRRVAVIEIGNKSFSYKKIKDLNERAMKKFKVTEEEAGYLVFSDSTSNHAYNPSENNINIITGKNEVSDIAQISDQLNISVLSAVVTKYYVFYPKNLL